MSGSGYDAVVDVDDEVCQGKGSARPPSCDRDTSGQTVGFEMETNNALRAISATPTSRRISNSTLPTSTRRPTAAAKAHPRDCPLPPQLRLAILQSGSFGQSRSIHNSLTSTPRRFFPAAGQRCSPAPTSSMSSRATLTCTARSGSPLR